MTKDSNRPFAVSRVNFPITPERTFNDGFGATTGLAEGLAIILGSSSRMPASLARRTADGLL
jgi:hypothetical protein